MRIFLLAALTLLAACAPSFRDQSVPMTTQAVDPERYSGLWFEIARFPVIFQRGCTATTAEYGVIAPDTLSVVNTCRQGSPDGPVQGIEGTAEIVGPGKLEVRLGRIPFAADYWILWVDDTYQTAVIGVPSGRAGWILARNPEISAETRASADRILTANGYDTTRLLTTPHARE